MHNDRKRAADYAFLDVPFTAFAHRGGCGWRNHGGLSATLLLAVVRVIAKTAGPPRRIAVLHRSRRVNGSGARGCSLRFVSLGHAAHWFTTGNGCCETPLATAPLAMTRCGRIVARADRLGTRQYQLGNARAVNRPCRNCLSTAVDRYSGHAVTGVRLCGRVT